MPELNEKYAIARLAGMFTLYGLGLTALGIAGALNFIKGGLGISIFTLALALGCFSLAAYPIWGYFRIRRHPGHGKRMDTQTGRDDAHASPPEGRARSCH